MTPLAVRGCGVVFGAVMFGLVWRSGEKNIPPSRMVRAVVLIGLGLRLAMATMVPKFQAPDEEAHFNYVKYLVEHRNLPVQPATLDFDVPNYESYQPPIFYAVSAVPYVIGRAVFGSDDRAVLVGMRLEWVALWLAAAVAVSKLLDVARFDDEHWRVGIMAVFCLTPTYVYTSSALSNDNAVVLWAHLAFLCAYRAETTLGACATGLLSGVGILSKLSALGAVLGALSLLGLSLRDKGRSASRALTSVALSALVTAVSIAPWIARNVSLYGSAFALDRGNPTANWPLVSGGVRVVRSLAGGFWGVAGIHSEISMVPGASFVLSGVVFTGLVAVALAPDAATASIFRGPARPLVVASSLAVGFTFVSALAFGLKTGMPHGRYMFSVLAPVGLFYTVGMRRIGRWLNSACGPMIGLPLGYTAVLVFVTLFSVGMRWGAFAICLVLSAAWFLAMSKSFVPSTPPPS